jgi:hypothetical protein
MVNGPVRVYVPGFNASVAPDAAAATELLRLSPGLRTVWPGKVATLAATVTHNAYRIIKATSF